MSHGYFNPGIDPNAFFDINTRQHVQRLIGGLTSNWTPSTGSTVIGTVGADIDHRDDTETLPAGLLPVDQDHLDGYRQVERAIVNNYTASVNASGTYNFTPRLKFTTTVGSQYTDVGFTRTDASGAKLLSGTTSLAGTTSRFAVSEITNDVKTLGFIAREQMAWADKFFLTLARAHRSQQCVRRQLQAGFLSVASARRRSSATHHTSRAYRPSRRCACALRPVRPDRTRGSSRRSSTTIRLP